MKNKLKPFPPNCIFIFFFVICYFLTITLVTGAVAPSLRTSPLLSTTRSNIGLRPPFPNCLWSKGSADWLSCHFRLRPRRYPVFSIVYTLLWDYFLDIAFCLVLRLYSIRSKDSWSTHLPWSTLWKDRGRLLRGPRNELEKRGAQEKE